MGIVAGELQSGSHPFDQVVRRGVLEPLCLCVHVVPRVLEALAKVGFDDTVAPQDAKCLSRTVLRETHTVIGEVLEKAGLDVVFVPEAYERVVDRAIQVWGAAGVSGDLPLAGMYQGARTLRLADGPDEVHKILIAKNVLKRYHSGEAWDFGN